MLEPIELEKFPKWVPQSWGFRGRVQEVIDGQTFNILLDLGFHTYVCARICAQGLALPSMSDQSSLVRTRAYQAKIAAVILMANRFVVIQTGPQFKQGGARWAQINIVDVETRRFLNYVDELQLKLDYRLLDEVGEPASSKPPFNFEPPKSGLE